jgi:hypothetical protein
MIYKDIPFAYPATSPEGFSQRQYQSFLREFYCDAELADRGIYDLTVILSESPLMATLMRLAEQA